MLLASHGSMHWFLPEQQTFMQRWGTEQSSDEMQSFVVVQNLSAAQKQSPSVVCEHRQTPKGPLLPHWSAWSLQKMSGQEVAHG